jgi:hypothetical protein
MAPVPSHDKSLAFANASSATAIGADQGPSASVFDGNRVDDPTEIDVLEDNLSDDMDQDHDPAQNISFLATARAKGAGQRKSSAQATSVGGLLQLLQKIRTEVRTDKTRLRSGEYPFPNKVSSRFDLYDPRNRAESFLDVTIVGESWFQCRDSGSSNARGRQLRPTNSDSVILGYVHNHHIYQERSKLPLPQVSQCLAWLTFSGETIHEHSLLNNPQGKQLRIYNAMTFPALLDERVDSDQEVPLVQVCHYNVVCTQLCEPYPMHILGQLEPELPQILQSQQVLNNEASVVNSN